MDMRSDILGVHLEGPFLAASRKGAHNPECLCDPVDGLVDDILRAADGCLRQITIAPELPHASARSVDSPMPAWFRQSAIATPIMRLRVKASPPVQAS
mgnify:CR=1 FL=1